VTSAFLAEPPAAGADDVEAPFNYSKI